jgi:hypothetical protein
VPADVPRFPELRHAFVLLVCVFFSSEKQCDASYLLGQQQLKGSLHFLHSFAFVFQFIGNFRYIGRSPHANQYIMAQTAYLCPQKTLRAGVEAHRVDTSLISIFAGWVENN